MLINTGNRLSAHKLRNILGAAVVASLCVMPAAGVLAQETKGQDETKQLVPSIYVTKVGAEPIADKVHGSGLIRPVEEVYVQPQIAGMAVKESIVEIGDQVARGNVLATLKDDGLLLEKARLNAVLTRSKATVAQLEAGVREAEANAVDPALQLERAKKLVKSGTIAQAQVDKLQAGVDAARARVNSTKENLAAGKLDIDVAQAQLDDVELRLSYVNIIAPVSGIVASKSVKVGAIANSQGGPLYTLIRDGKLELQAEFFEDDIVRIMPGHKTSIATSGQREPFAGTVRLIDPTIDPATHLGIVRIDVDNPEKIRSGMFAEVVVTIAEKSALVVPLSTLTTNDRGTSVLKVSGGRIRMTSVETGIETDGKVEIVSGLSEGDLIVTKAGAFVRDGDAVNPVLEEANAIDDKSVSALQKQAQ